MKLKYKSFAKINWALEILGKRTDGYHELRTIFQTIDIHDELIFEPLEQGIEIICDYPGVPCDETNLVYKAADRLRSYAGLDKGIRITINKNIPIGAGLGGGSSNAAVTLIALTQIWNINIQRRDLFSIASDLGSDVPYFLIGGTCLGLGRGEELYSLPEIEAESILIINPGIHVSTKEAYGKLKFELTNSNNPVKMPLCLEAAYASLSEHSEQPKSHTKSRWSWLFNDLEISVFSQHGLLPEIKNSLLERGASSVLMSGSGSTIFAIFDSNLIAGARKDLKKYDWWCRSASTLSREEYLKGIKN